MNKAAKTMAMVAVVGLVAGMGFGAALTDSRDTPQRVGEELGLTVASNVIIYAGSLVAVNSAGYAVPAADASGYAVVGRAAATVDNRTAVYVATKTIGVAKGVFRWVNGDVIVAADIGKLVYVTDDQTVNKTGGGQNIIAGSVIDVDAGGVWVDTGRVGPIGAATPSSLAVAGAATVGTTLAVSGATTFGGAVAVGGNKFNVTYTNGNTAVAGTLGVAGATTVSNLTINGATVSLPHLPTATNGLTAGQIWSDTGVLTVF